MFKAVAHRVIIKIQPKTEKKTDGGIITDVGFEMVRDQYTGELKPVNKRRAENLALTEGKVIDIGPEVEIGKGEYNIGDTVKFVAHAGHPDFDEGDDISFPTLRFINDVDIFARKEE